MQILVAFSSLNVPTIKYGSNKKITVAACVHFRLAFVAIYTHAKTNIATAHMHWSRWHACDDIFYITDYISSAVPGAVMPHFLFTGPTHRDGTEPLPDSHPALTMELATSCDWVPPITFTNVAEYEYLQRCVFCASMHVIANMHEGCISI